MTPSKDSKYFSVDLLWLSSLLRSMAPVLLIGFATLLLLPSLTTGFIFDDYLFIHKLSTAPFSKHLFNLYSFIGEGKAKEFILNGTLPWWGAENFKLDFFRPLSSLLFSLDYMLFGTRPLLYHLHTLLWVFALIYVWHTLFKMFLPHRVAILALIIIISSGVLSFPVLWIANRHILISICLGSIGLWSYTQYRQKEISYQMPLALFFLATSLLASETGISIFSYLFCYELFIAKDSPSKRILSLLPFSILLVSYIALYKLFQFGVHNHDHYIDPFASPRIFIEQLFIKIPLLIDKVFIGFNFVKHSLINFALAVSILVIFYRYLRNENRQEKEAYYWLVVGSILSLVPLLTISNVEESIIRVILPFMIGASPIIAYLILRVWEKRHQPISARDLSRIFLATLSIGFGINYFVLSPITMLVLPKEVKKYNKGVTQYAINIKLDSPCQYAVVISSQYSFSNFYIPSIRHYYNIYTPKNWFFLAENSSGATLTTSSKNQFILDSTHNTTLPENNRKLFQKNILHTGQTFQTNIFTATLLGTANEIPTKAQFNFKENATNDICWTNLSQVKVLGSNSGIDQMLIK